MQYYEPFGQTTCKPVQCWFSVRAFLYNLSSDQWIKSQGAKKHNLWRTNGSPLAYPKYFWPIIHWGNLLIVGLLVAANQSCWFWWHSWPLTGAAIGQNGGLVFFFLESNGNVGLLCSLVFLGNFGIGKPKKYENYFTCLEAKDSSSSSSSSSSSRNTFPWY